MLATSEETFGQGNVEFEIGDKVRIEGGYFPECHGVVYSPQGNWDYADEDDRLFYVAVLVEEDYCQKCIVQRRKKIQLVLRNREKVCPECGHKNTYHLETIPINYLEKVKIEEVKKFNN